MERKGSMDLSSDLSFDSRILTEGRVLETGKSWNTSCGNDSDFADTSVISGNFSIIPEGLTNARTGCSVSSNGLYKMMPHFMYPGTKELTFPYKLYRIVCQCKTGAVTWNGDGTSILININEFQVEYLNKGIFQTKRLASFVRQLNLYGFKKVKDQRFLKERDSNCYVWQYEHQYFTRDNPGILGYVNRTHSLRTSSRPKGYPEDTGEIGVRDGGYGPYPGHVTGNFGPYHTFEKVGAKGDSRVYGDGYYGPHAQKNSKTDFVGEEDRSSKDNCDNGDNGEDGEVCDSRIVGRDCMLTAYNGSGAGQGYCSTTYTETVPLISLDDGDGDEILPKGLLEEIGPIAGSYDRDGRDGASDKKDGRRKRRRRNAAKDENKENLVPIRSNVPCRRGERRKRGSKGTVRCSRSQNCPQSLGRLTSNQNGGQLPNHNAQSLPGMSNFRRDDQRDSSGWFTYNKEAMSSVTVRDDANGSGPPAPYFVASDESAIRNVNNIQSADQFPFKSEYSISPHHWNTFCDAELPRLGDPYYMDHMETQLANPPLDTFGQSVYDNRHNSSYNLLPETSQCDEIYLVPCSYYEL